jgi:hypothetical protein
MLFSCPCPRCGTPKQYLSEEVGKTGYCLQCGMEFRLKDNPRQVSGHLGKAAAAVVGLILFVGGAIWVRAQFQSSVIQLHDRLADAEIQAIKEAEKAMKEVERQIKEEEARERSRFRDTDN